MVYFISFKGFLLALALASYVSAAPVLGSVRQARVSDDLSSLIYSHLILSSYFTACPHLRFDSRLDLGCRCHFGDCFGLRWTVHHRGAGHLPFAVE